MASGTVTDSYDRAAEVKQFEASKLGVKGLVDSGITTIPRFFVHPPETLAELGRSEAHPGTTESIPIIDLSGGLDPGERRPEVVRQVSRACREWGIFQIVNHGVPAEVLDRVTGAVKEFHQLPTEEKARMYNRERDSGVSFYSNVDLFHRDTLRIRLGPKFAGMDDIPKVCRAEVVDWDQHVQRIGSVLLELLSEGLGLSAGRLQELTCLETSVMSAHIYPQCPQPELTLGTPGHTDPAVITLLVHNQLGGLQVKHGDKWMDVKSVPGALVINIGDILQIMSNDEYKSVQHRVLANPLADPRVSIAVFCNPSNQDREYGPIPEIISPEKPALFREFTFADYLRRFFTKELEGMSLMNYYRL